MRALRPIEFFLLGLVVVGTVVALMFTKIAKKS